MTQLPDDMAAHNRALIDDFRTHGAPEGRHLLLLTTTGARSGSPHTTPLMYIPDGERLLIVAANAGAPTHPAWFHNLRAHPEVRVEVGKEDYRARAVVPEGAAHDALFDLVSSRHPFFADYQANVARTIPVVVLERIS